LWSIWRASVDFPQSIVPVKNWSSATVNDHAIIRAALAC
jgi:hypothetical protein